ncbi:MAG: hypothetical protein ILP19_06870, partial [Oscillospiraceae bacterium]|nr:hypothetical protein [Oscillospiraceae bacterium]
MKRIGKILLHIIAVVLSGCMRVNLEVEMRKDGTTAMTARYGMDTAYASDEDFGEDGREPIHFTVDGTEYVGYEEKEEYQTYEELTKSLTELNDDGTSLFTSTDIRQEKGLFATKYIFDAASAPLVGDSGEYGEISKIIVVDFTLKMPGKVKNVTGGEILEDGTVKFLFAPEAGNTFHAESSVPNVISILIAAGIAIAIIAAVLAVTSKKRDQQV